jgi:Glycosyl hydrolase family 76
MLLFGLFILSVLSSFFVEPMRCTAPVNARVKIHDSPGSRTKNLDRLRTSIQILQQPDYYSPTFGFPTASEWTSTVLASVLIDSAVVTNDSLYFEGFVAVFNNESVLELLFQANDDKLWVCLACLRGAVYAANHDPQSAPAFLERAQQFYNLAAAGWQNATCHGGLFSAPGSGYQNAVTNELWITASASMYQIFGETSMLDAALQGWTWFNRSGMINSEGLVNDGLTNNCTSAFRLEVTS